MTKKEAVKALRIAFNKWAAGLPDIEFRRIASNVATDTDDPTISFTGTIHMLELGAEEEGGAK